MSASGDLLRIIDAAYEVADEASRFATLVDALESHLFGANANQEVTELTTAYLENESLIEKHTTRIVGMISRSIQERGETAQPNHAVLTMSARTFSVTGNSAAQKLFECEFPNNLEALPLDHDTVSSIKAMASAQSSSDHIYLVSVGHSDAKPCLALVQRPLEKNEQIRISISFIDWSQELLAQIGRALNLTDSETEILHGYLQKRSQKEIAELRKRSLETVKVQSKSILRKAGATKMSEVVQLSAGIAYLYRLHPKAGPAQESGKWETPKQNLHFCDRPDGSQFAWYKIGHGRKPVLFIHGVFQGPFFTRKFVNELSEADLYLLCPSRPGFGYSHPCSSRKSYTVTVVHDAITLLNEMDIPECLVMSYQGGSIHAFSIANELGVRAKGLFLVDGAVPLTQSDLASIEKNPKVFAAAASRTPYLLKMLMKIGKSVYMRRGVGAFLQSMFKTSPHDLSTLNDPEMFRVQAEGVFHVAEQGSEIWVREGRALMQDWADLFEAYTGPRYWLSSALGKVMDVELTQTYLNTRTSTENKIRVVSNAGDTLLHTHPKEITETMQKIYTS